MAEKKKTELSLEEVQAQMKAMLEEAKAEAAKIVEEARREAGLKAAAESQKAKDDAAYQAYMDELVDVKLFKDNGKYKDDMFVGVNGENCVIKRGERVRIKRKFAEVLDNSDRQDYETSKLIEAKSAEFEKSGL
jgi:hypothetical protein